MCGHKGILVKGCLAMADQRTIIDEIAVKDLEDGSVLKVVVESCTELGNNSKPGLQLYRKGYIVTF